MRNKTIFLNDFISTHNFDLFAISETWLGCEATNDIHINLILPDGYMMHHVDRNSERGGGGIAFIYKMCLEVRPNKLLKYTQFEHMSCRVIINKMNIDIVFYRTPTSPQNGFTTTSFLDECSTIMSQLTICKSELIVVGDVNIHLDNQTLHHTVEFIQSLESHGLQQHIQVPTHHHGHTLDVLISRDTSTLLTDIEVVDINLCNDNGDLISDHYSIECTVQQSTQLQNRKIVSYRNMKQIDIDQFCKDVSESPTLNNIQGTVNELVHRYNLGLRALLDKHAPINGMKTCTVVHRVTT